MFEAKSVSKQYVLIVITWPIKIVQWPETMFIKLATFLFVHQVHRVDKKHRFSSLHKPTWLRYQSEDIVLDTNFAMSF